MEVSKYNGLYKQGTVLEDGISLAYALGFTVFCPKKVLQIHTE